ncbi:PPK2 family polyphosphate kinase [Ramlibacter albus]|uniref:Polyphosphate--nucleotide phosphotransferase n=1 Tax=Ramlibacter albus TaxID=2079448 RepID=A0A923S3K0_9BURK|nr:PPK2 family polyphosphate kinase [Ramlibacter albus]MBC5766639.1 polyphosphate--nucleotide phosphotransferase [Ramlibacter albus]
MASNDRTAKALRKWRVDAADAAFSVESFDPGAKPLGSGNKSADKARVEALAAELDELQNLFYADGRHKLLVVLQGIDTSGKDGTLRAVFGRMSPIGVRTVAWRAPNEAERARDYLWRIHAQVPAAGEIVGFNRSHYEDVLVPVVEGWIDEHTARQRYAHINDFERLLCETGTVILKFMLHISKDEQRRRLQERIDDPAKRWKFKREDIGVRAKWDLYQAAYSHAIGATATKHSPWHIVPADSKTQRNLMVATVVRDTMRRLDLQFPDEDASLRDLKVS